MESSESSFISPEGAYTLAEEHKPTILQSLYTNPGAPTQPGTYTRLSTIVINFPHTKTGGSQGLSSLLGGGKEKGDKKDTKKATTAHLGVPPIPDKDESVTSSDNTGDDLTPLADPGISNPGADPQESTSLPQTTLFSSKNGPTVPTKKKSVNRPKHNLRTTSSSFVTRLHTIEGLTKTLTAKAGEVTFVFYNSGKSFYWTETGVKNKVNIAIQSFS